MDFGFLGGRDEFWAELVLGLGVEPDVVLRSGNEDISESKKLSSFPSVTKR